MKTFTRMFMLSAIYLSFTKTLIAVPFMQPVRFLEVPPANGEIIFDGLADNYYSDVQSTDLYEATSPITNVNDTDYSLTFRVCYNSHKLYFLAYILDDFASEIPYTTGPNPWTWDNIQIFLSLDTASYTVDWDTNTNFVQFNRGLDSVQYHGNASSDDFELYCENTEDGWVLEAGIPWQAFLSDSQLPGDIEFYYGTANGFDVQGTDSDVNIPDSWKCRMQWDPDPPYSDTGDESIFFQRTRFGIMRFASGLSINDNDFGATNMVYPNPCTHEINIRAMPPDCLITIYTTQGVKVLEKKMATADEKINVDLLLPGIYNLLINGEYTVRFVKE